MVLHGRRTSPRACGGSRTPLSGWLRPSRRANLRRPLEPVVERTGAGRCPGVRSAWLPAWAPFPEERVEAFLDVRTAAGERRSRPRPRSRAASSGHAQKCARAALWSGPEPEGAPPESWRLREGLFHEVLPGNDPVHQAPAFRASAGHGAVPSGAAVLARRSPICRGQKHHDHGCDEADAHLGVAEGGHRGGQDQVAQ